MPDVVLATCAKLPSGDEDGDLLTAELARCGVHAQWVDWAGEHWAGDAAASPDMLIVVRSTWDYMSQRARFLDWVRARRRIANPADVIEWNTDKAYLADLAAAGVATVPTTLARPGERVVLPDAEEFVLKPSVGAGSRGAGRFTRADTAAAHSHAEHLHAAGRTVMAQPYLTDVDTAGETALVYVDATFSHAVRKAPMLPPDTAHDLDTKALFVEEAITARTPDPAELAVGAAACAAVRERFGVDPLYARVDLLPSSDGPVVVELELSEPSLFLGYGDSAAATFAAAIAARA